MGLYLVGWEKINTITTLVQYGTVSEVPRSMTGQVYIKQIVCHFQVGYLLRRAHTDLNANKILNN